MRAFFRSLALKYVALAILPLGVLIYQPASNFAVLSLGERVLLRTRPLDPRDFLRGDYVTLGYDISDIPEELLSGENLPDDEEDRSAILRSGWKSAAYYGSYYRDIYVTLKLDDDGIGSLSGASFAPPSDGLYLKGTITWNRYSYTVDYGIGVYYVPEGTGGELEDAVQKGGVLADVRVFKGRCVLKELTGP
jgi:uncharacterized membrane-anchored protein